RRHEIRSRFAVSLRCKFHPLGQAGLAIFYEIGRQRDGTRNAGASVYELRKVDNETRTEWGPIPRPPHTGLYVLPAHRARGWIVGSQVARTVLLHCRRAARHAMRWGAGRCGAPPSHAPCCWLGAATLPTIT